MLAQTLVHTLDEIGGFTESEHAFWCSYKYCDVGTDTDAYLRWACRSPCITLYLMHERPIPFTFRERGCAYYVPWVSTLALLILGGAMGVW